MDQTICWTSVLISYLLTVFKCLFRVVFIDSSEVGHCEISRSSVDSSSDRAGEPGAGGGGHPGRVSRDLSCADRFNLHRYFTRQLWTSSYLHKEHPRALTQKTLYRYTNRLLK